jgi:putative spermidine/putrescine transport system ATP-binding protein
LLDGRDITNVSPQRREIGVVFQSYALFPHMTAAENVGYGLKLRKIPREEIAKRVDEALALVQLTGKGSRYPKELSGGEQQRVAIARALAIRPQLLLLDEPLSNLDARLREEMRTELKRIQRTTGVTTIFVTHDQAEAFGTADRIAVLEKGLVKQVGTPSEIYKRPASAFVARFIGRSNRLKGSFKDAEKTMTVNGRAISVDVGVNRDVPDATLYLRPEDMKLEKSDPANAMTGRVESIVYGGSTVEYLVNTPVGELEVCRFASQAQYNVGDEVTVFWSPSSGALLDSEQS